jgi:hypothetical protein
MNATSLELLSLDRVLGVSYECFTWNIGTMPSSLAVLRRFATSQGICNEQSMRTRDCI